MKVRIIICLLLAFLVQNISKTIIVLNFERNREYIAAALCVNKEEEDSCCKGSCHLKKQLEQDDRNNGSSDNAKIKFEKSEYCSTSLKISVFNQVQRIVISDLDEKTVRGSQTLHYRPPKPDAA